MAVRPLEVKSAVRLYAYLSFFFCALLAQSKTTCLAVLHHSERSSVLKQEHPDREKELDEAIALIEISNLDSSLAIHDGLWDEVKNLSENYSHQEFLDQVALLIDGYEKTQNEYFAKRPTYTKARPQPHEAKAPRCV